MNKRIILGAISILLIGSLTIPLLSCNSSVSSSNNVVLSSPEITQKNWYVTLENTPIENTSLSDNHLFASTDYGLVHCFPMDKTAIAEEIISIQSERCLNHKVKAGTDKERVPISRYELMEKGFIHTYNLYTENSESSVRIEEEKGISLKSYPTFAADTMKYHFNLDTSSCTSALIKYGNLLFINRNQQITEHSLPNFVLKSALVGSTVYYLSSIVNDPNAHYFRALNMQSSKYTWDYIPSEEYPTFQPIFDSSFTKTADSIFVFFKKRNAEARTEVLIAELDYSGAVKSSKIIVSESAEEPSTSDIAVVYTDNHHKIIGELFQTGTVQCYQSEDYSLLWDYPLPKKQSVLSVSFDSVSKQIALLLSDGSIQVLNIETGFLQYSAPIYQQNDNPIVFSRGSIQKYNQHYVGFLNNSHSTPFRSLLFIHQINEKEAP